MRRIQTSVSDLGLRWDDLDIAIWPGVILSETPDILTWAIDNQYIQRPRIPGNMGNLGAGLAHITLWHNVSQRPSNEIVFVMEDNCIFTRESLGAIDHFSQYEFDFFNLAVDRPDGTPTSEPGVLRMFNNRWEHETWFHQVPNVWLSSYMITPHGARKLLQEMKRIRCDISTDTQIIDQCLVIAMHSSTDYIGYVVNHHRYFGHLQTWQDSRVEYNTG